MRTKLKAILAALLITAVAATSAGCRIHLPGTEDPTATAPETTAAPYEDVVKDSYTYRKYADHAEIIDYTGKDATITLPEKFDGLKVTRFGDSFKRSLYLTILTIPGCYVEIEDEAFSECYKLKNVAIKKGDMTRIGTRAFFGCQSLVSLRIPETVKEIAPDAFKYCTDVLIYGTPGSAAEEAAAGYSSIYFRDVTKDETTTKAKKKKKKETTTEKKTEEASSQAPEESGFTAAD